MRASSPGIIAWMNSPAHQNLGQKVDHGPVPRSTEKPDHVLVASETVVEKAELLESRTTGQKCADILHALWGRVSGESL